MCGNAKRIRPKYANKIMSHVRNVDKYKAKVLMFNYERENYYIDNSGDP